MRKILALFVLTIVSASFVIANNAEGFKGPRCDIKKITVAEALKMSDDTMVTVQGNILKKISDDEYQFKDSTGTMIVEIDHDKWNGISADTNDTLILSGEIDKEYNHTKLDVDMVRKANK